MLARYDIVWCVYIRLGFTSVVFPSCAAFTSSFSSFPRPVLVLVETLSQGRGWCDSFPISEVVVFRLYLYRMDLVLILQSRPLDDAWPDDLQGCPGNFHNHLVHIFHDRCHRRSLSLGVENFRSRMLVIRCIHNAVVDYCPHIPSFVPRL